MSDRNYNQDEIDLLKSEYGGTNDDWNGFLLKPQSDLIQELTPDWVDTARGLAGKPPVDQEAPAMTDASGNIHYDNDTAGYSGNYASYFNNGVLNINTTDIEAAEFKCATVYCKNDYF